MVPNLIICIPWVEGNNILFRREAPACKILWKSVVRLQKKYVMYVRTDKQMDAKGELLPHRTTSSTLDQNTKYWYLEEIIEIVVLHRVQ